MNYNETLDYLYNQHPAFQRVGAAAYKPGIETSIELDELYGHPHKAYRCIHVAGTNGKGSVSHTIASILQKSGYKVGLYTSPHLVDFRERIRVNGEMIPKQSVTQFVATYIEKGFHGSPSFFELTMMMAFDYFRQEKVDFAVIEVGLGGRLDSTNIITPLLSVITNISKDHTQFLGNTLEAIAHEKAGIMKPGIPCVIGEATGGVRSVFEQTAKVTETPAEFAQDSNEIVSVATKGFAVEYHTRSFGMIESDLSGHCQRHNANTILHAIGKLRQQGVDITDEAIKAGFKSVCQTTGLMGRWMKISDSPLTICDTGHNVGGIQYISEQLQQLNCSDLRMVIGFVNDKDIEHILELLPHNATYYFTQASIPRAQHANVVRAKAEEKGLYGESYESVAEAYRAALSTATPDSVIFVGGSTFVVADFLISLKN